MAFTHRDIGACIFTSESFIFSVMAGQIAEMPFILYFAHIAV